MSQLIPFLGFLEDLSEMDEATPDWRALRSGYFILRQIESGATAPHELLHLYEAVEQLGVQHSAFRPLVELLMSAETRRPWKEIAGLIHAYGSVLLSSSRWRSAVDVFALVVAKAEAIGVTKLELNARLLRCHALRCLGRDDDARLGYDEIRQRARAVRSPRYILEADLGHSKLLAWRGNLPAADEGLRRVLVAARRQRLRPVIGKTLMELGLVAAFSERYVDAIRYWHRAERYVEDLRDLDQVRQNIGSALVDLGRFVAARDVNLIVQVTTADEDVRTAASLNLIELEYLSGHQLAFTAARRAMAVDRLRPYHKARYYEICGLGFARFGNAKAAKESLRRAVSISELHALNQTLVRVEQALVDLERGEKKASSRSGRLSEREERELRRIGDRLAEQRAAVLSA